jgi:cytochrome c-type biogenesis protein
MITHFLENPDLYIGGSLIAAYLAAYVGGVLTSFTPCIYPVIPITIAYIGARGSESKLRGLAVSLFYVLGMAVTYTALGGLAAFTGRLFGQIQSSPWMYFLVANICVLMGLSMLGLFTITIPVPRAIANFRITDGNKGFGGSFLVGIVSGLVVSPCTTPVLAVLLSLIASKQQVFFGMSLMFVFAFGLGTLLIIIGTFAHALAGIPRSGVWMTRINRIFGVILIGMGEYFLIKAGMFWI